MIRNKKGSTLMEVLMMITLIAITGISAFLCSLALSRNINYLKSYQNAVDMSNTLSASFRGCEDYVGYLISSVYPQGVLEETDLHWEDYDYVWSDTAESLGLHTQFNWYDEEGNKIMSDCNKSKDFVSLVDDISGYNVREDYNVKLYLMPREDLILKDKTSYNVYSKDKGTMYASSGLILLKMVVSEKQESSDTHTLTAYTHPTAEVSTLLVVDATDITLDRCNTK